MAIEIVSFPINSMVIFHSFLYVYQRVIVWRFRKSSLIIALALAMIPLHSPLIYRAWMLSSYNYPIKLYPHKIYAFWFVFWQR
jgi:hypothetical protein